MTGRQEHDLKKKMAIRELLKNLPESAADFYYAKQISAESTTCYDYLYKLKHFAETVNKDLTLVDESDISSYFAGLDYITDRRGRVKKTSNAYQAGIWFALNDYYTYLSNRKVIKINPMQNIKRPNKKDKITRIDLSMKDLDKILTQTLVTGHKLKERDYTILFLLMTTGMRRSALTEINVEDINFDTHELKIVDKRNKEHIYPLSDEMESVLKKWLAKREEFLGDVNTNALFISRNLKRIEPQQVYDLTKKYSRQALGVELSPHKLRGAFITLYYEENGHDIKATCEAAGHENIATTSRYITSTSSARRDAVGFMSKNLKKVVNN